MIKVQHCCCKKFKKNRIETSDKRATVLQEFVPQQFVVSWPGFDVWFSL